MEDYDVRSAASILASVKEQEARFEQLTRALEEERRNVTLQLERANLPPNNPPTSQPLAWQQVVMQVTPCQHVCMLARPRLRVSLPLLPSSCPPKNADLAPLPSAHLAHRVFLHTAIASYHRRFGLRKSLLDSPP